MNKHKAYFSAMGIEPSKKSVKQEKFEKFEEQLRIIMNIYDPMEVLTSVRKIFEEVTNEQTKK